MEKALVDSLDASYKGDANGTCSLYTPAYKREVLRENERLRASTCEELVEAMVPVLKQLSADPAPKVTQVEVEGDEASARLEIQTHFGPAASKRFLVREDDRWKISHDEDLTAGAPTGP